MAFDAVQEVLAIFPWLSELGPEIYEVITQGVLNDDPTAVTIQNIRQTQSYKTRFAGLTARQAAGLPAVSEAEYLDVERGYLEQLRNFNILGTLGYNDQTAFRSFAAELIGSDVSVAEFNRRLDRATAVMRDSSEFIRTRFEEWYGVSPSDDALLVYFLDPELGTDIIEDQVATATIGGEAFRYGLNITRTRAEILRRDGVSADLARQGFSNIARELPVLNRLAQIHNTSPLAQEQLEEFFFHEDPKVAERRYRTFQTALNQFQSGGARGITREGGLEQFVDRDRSV